MTKGYKEKEVFKGINFLKFCDYYLSDKEINVKVTLTYISYLLLYERNAYLISILNLTVVHCLGHQHLQSKGVEEANNINDLK